MSTGGERGESGGLRRSNRIRKAAAKDSHALSDGDAPVQSDGDIGAPWTKDEVTKFYNGVREHGTAWKKIASELKNRTPEMVAALYQQYSGYLSLSPEHSSALALYTLISEADRRGTSSLATETKGQASKRSASTPLQGSERKRLQAQRAATEPRRDRKRKLFGDSPPPPDRARRRSAVARRELDHGSGEDEANDENEEEEALEFPASRKGRGVATTTTTRTTRRMSSMEATGTSTGSNSNSGAGAQVTDVLPPKLRAKWGNNKQHHQQAVPALRSTPTREAKRKRASETRAESSEKAKAQIQRTLTHFMKSDRAAKWCMYEWFCADMDRPFFEHNDFQHCLEEMGLGHVTHLTRMEWSHVRSIMGKPRRFSQAFLQGERAKLHEYRANIRELRNGKSPLSRSFYPPVAEIPLPIPLGMHVLAFHPSQRRLSRGAVIAVGDGQYQVEFTDKQMSANLDGIWVADTDVMIHEPRPSATDAAGQESPRTPTRATIALAPYPQEDLRGMVTLLRLLLQKEQLITQLRDMNNKAEASVGRGDVVGDDFQKQYAHIVVSLTDTNGHIEPSLRRIHARSPLHSPEADRNAARWIFPSPTDSPSDSPSKLRPSGQALKTGALADGGNTPEPDQAGPPAQ